MTVTAVVGVEGALERLTDKVEFLVEEAQRRSEARESLLELTKDLSPIASQSLNSITLALAEAERRGYTDFAKSGLGVVDKVVTSFSEDDVEALGDNIVLILETIKEMTQPEIMELTRSTFQHIHDVEVPDEPPSVLSLIRQLRDPEARRGLSRLIFLLKSLGSVDQSKRKEARE